MSATWAGVIVFRSSTIRSLRTDATSSRCTRGSVSSRASAAVSVSRALKTDIRSSPLSSSRMSARSVGWMSAILSQEMFSLTSPLNRLISDGSDWTYRQGRSRGSLKPPPRSRASQPILSRRSIPSLPTSTWTTNSRPSAWRRWMS